jgi:hypothetical protein
MNNDDEPTTQRNLVFEMAPSRMEALEKNVEGVNGKLDIVMRMLKGVTEELLQLRQDLNKEQSRGRRVERKLGLVRCVREAPCGDDGDDEGGGFNEHEADTGPNGASLAHLPDV